MVYDDILDIIKNKRIDSNLDVQHINSCIREIEQKIKNYCCISTVPKALYYTWANMALDLLDYETAYNNSQNSTVDDTVQSILSGNFGSISMGDTSWKQGELDLSNPNTKAMLSHSANLDSLILNYKEELNSFRRIW